MKRSLAAATILLSICASGCASISGGTRILSGTGFGAGIGAVGGAALSPNRESIALNALIFGLTGALLGGALAYVTDSSPVRDGSARTLQERELKGVSAREFVVHPAQELPVFLKKRILPTVIEEYVETDRVSEEGSLHEPHRVYRIKRPTELVARPSEVSPDSQQRKSQQR